MEGKGLKRGYFRLAAEPFMQLASIYLQFKEDQAISDIQKSKYMQAAY